MKLLQGNTQTEIANVARIDINLNKLREILEDTARVYDDYSGSEEQNKFQENILQQAYKSFISLLEETEEIIANTSGVQIVFLRARLVAIKDINADLIENVANCLSQDEVPALGDDEITSDITEIQY